MKMAEFMCEEIFKIVQHGTRERMERVVRCCEEMYKYVTILKSPENIRDEQIKRYVKLKYLDCRKSREITSEGIRTMTEMRYLKCNKNITDGGIREMKNKIGRAHV